MYYWLCMIVAIIAEVAGTLAMKHSIVTQQFSFLMLMYVMLIISYAALAIAVKRIPIAVAYGAWESLGLVLISGMSYIFFQEPLNIFKILAVLLILIGIVLLELGTYQDDEESDHAA